MAKYDPIIVLSRQTSELLDSLREEGKWQAFAERFIEPVEVDSNIHVDAVDDEDNIIYEGKTSEGLVIGFADGSNITVRPYSEMLLITEDGIESVFAITLSTGDEVVVMRGEATRSIFESILTRVNHLVKVDHKIVEFWRSSITNIIAKNADYTKQWPMSQIITSLRERGCHRVDQTIKAWFRGTTLAPQHAHDIRHILELAGTQRPEEMARVVSREIQAVRTFNQRLGRRLKAKIIASLTGDDIPAIDRLDFEIDEAIEDVDVEPKTIVSIQESKEGVSK